MIWVDDIIVAGGKQQTAQVLKLLESRYKMVFLGPVSWYLGIKIVRGTNKEGLKYLAMSQEAYADKVTKKFLPEGTKPQAVPMLKGSEPLPEVEDASEASELEEWRKKVPYREAIGSLMYLMMCTRPDIATAVVKLSKFAAAPTKAHWRGVQRVLQYLKHTMKFGLVYIRNKSDVQASVYVDASYGDSDTLRRSTTGIASYVHGNLVGWASQTQKCVSKSTAEAEYVALSEAVAGAIWLRRLMLELTGVLPDKILVFEDNMGALFLAKNQADHRRSKHIDVRYHFTRFYVQEGVVDIQKLDTRDMIADVFTKALPRVRFEELRAKLGVMDVHEMQG